MLELCEGRISGIRVTSVINMIRQDGLIYQHREVNGWH